MIAGVRWLWRYTRLRGTADGWTQYQTKRQPATVLIHDRLKRRKRLEIELHEWLHCVFPQVDESVVADAAKDGARLLWTLGYRLNEQGEDGTA